MKTVVGSFDPSSSRRAAPACGPGRDGAGDRRGAALRRLGRDEGGGVAVIFTICSFVALLLVAGAIDFGRITAFKSRLQNTLDSAALAASSAYVLDPNRDATLALAEAQAFFDKMIGTENGAVLVKQLDTLTQTVSLSATATVKTPLLALARMPETTLSLAAVATASESLGSGAEYEVEMSLMLDVTGSMASDSGDGTSKIDALKAAAKALIDIMIPAKGPAHARLALAPFSSRINIGDFVAPVTGLPLTKQTATTYQCNGHSVCTPGYCSEYYTSGHREGQCRRWVDGSCTWQYETCASEKTSYLKRCITERTGAPKFSDQAPTSGFTSTYVDVEDDALNCGPTLAMSVQPMSADRTELKDRIDALAPGGSTAGHLGTAWAWYMLAPGWSTVFTGTSAPRPYGTARNKKIAVLMTDGQYNLYYAAGQGDSPTQAKALCDAMKAPSIGIEIYTIGFKLDVPTAAATLRYCATDANHYFQAENADQLLAAFREIAHRSVPLHLSQ